MTFSFTSIKRRAVARRAVMIGLLPLAAAVTLGVANSALAQTRPGTLLAPAGDPFRGGVPDPAPTPGAVTISIADAGATTRISKLRNACRSWRSSPLMRSRDAESATRNRVSDWAEDRSVLEGDEHMTSERGT